MALPIVDALLDAVGVFLFPVLLFAAGAVGYGVLLVSNRLLASAETKERPAEASEASDGATDTDRHDG